MAAIPVPVAGDPTAQSWAAAVAGKLNTFAMTSLTKTLNATGGVIVTPAEFAPGLTTVAGWAVGANSNDAGKYAQAAVLVTGGNYAIRVEVSSGTAWTAAANLTVKLHIVAWGT